MQTRVNSTGFFNPFFMWSDFALKTSEMMMASAQVINHRTSRMAVAGPTPSMFDQREFALMGTEKLDAMAESAQAMATRMMNVNPELGLQAFELMMKGSSAMLSLATSRNFGESFNRQAHLARVMTESAQASTALTASAAKIAHDGLAPIHSRATANAKRLADI